MTGKGEKAQFILLPPKAGTCRECATAHDPRQPHNQQSLYYQYRFYSKHGRWPTWRDAMAHCTEEIKTLWIDALEERGVIVPPEDPVSNPKE